MRRLLLAVIVAAPLLHAQRLTFSDPLPLANTRYGAYDGQPRVETNGEDFFLFWQAENNLRVTRLVEGEQRVGRHVIATESNDNAAVAWTGTHFLVMAGTREVTGQLLDSNAEPVGGPFRVFENGRTYAAASNGESVLLLHLKGSRLHASALTPAGKPTGVSTAVMPTEELPVNSAAVASDGDGYIALVSTSRGVLALGYAGDGRERWRTGLYTTTNEKAPGEVGIASDGSAYFAAWQLEDGEGVQGVRIRANGTANTTITLEPFAERTSYSGPVGVVWTGAHWAVAYTIKSGNGQNGRLRIAYVHPTFPEIAARQEPGPGYDPALAVIDGRIVLTWRPESEATPAVAAILPVDEGEPEPVTFGAADQHLLATAAALDSTLAVWNETADSESTLRAGIRSSGGGWVERHVSSRPFGGGVAASDGRDFVFAGSGVTGPAAIFLDDTARVTLGPVPLPFRVFSIAWTGTDYLIAGTSSLARLSRNGTVSASVTIRGFLVESVASNGTETMALLTKEVRCPFLCPDEPGELAFALLGPDLRPIGTPRFLDMKDVETRSDAEVVWDGNRFVAAWTVDRSVKVLELPTGEGDAEVLGRITISSPLGAARIAAVEGGAAIAWRELNEETLRTRTRAASVREDEPLVATTLEDRTNNSGEQPLIAALANGAVGLFTSEPLFAAPYHGSMRIALRVAMAPAARPEPPHLTGVVREGRVELAWTAPPQDVGGYRIEYLIGSDGAWKEIDRWFDADDDAVTLSLEVQSGVPYLFRIRAFNEAGVSEYSAPVLLNVTRRRAVR